MANYVTCMATVFNELVNVVIMVLVKEHYGLDDRDVIVA